MYFFASLLIVTAASAEESLLIQVCQWPQNTAQTIKLVILDNDKAGEATMVTVTIARDVAVSDEEWVKMLAFVQTVYGTPIMQDNTTVKFIFERHDMSVDAWFNLLSNVEAIFVAVRSMVEGCTKNNACVTIELS
jgi:hypothetical protein